MSLQTHEAVVIADLPPIVLRNDFAEKLRGGNNELWRYIADDTFEIIGLSSHCKPGDEPLLVVRHSSKPAIRREILLSRIRSANGIPLPQPEVLKNLKVVLPY